MPMLKDLKLEKYCLTKGVVKDYNVTTNKKNFYG